MKEQTLISALEMHDRALNSLMAERKKMQEVIDKTYTMSLTHVMMWDVLFLLLEARGIFTKDQFDAALQELGQKTEAAMDAEIAAKATLQ